MMRMNKAEKIMGIVLGVAILAIFAGAVLTGDWSEELSNSDPAFEGAPFDTNDAGSINNTLFEVYGPVLLVLALMMFGAIIGGVYIAKEDDDDDSD
jgi:NADH:ubiquinone oxidoreductase subunit 6 (subunit J)